MINTQYSTPNTEYSRFSFPRFYLAGASDASPDARKFFRFGKCLKFFCDKMIDGVIDMRKSFLSELCY
jgi:hypothetical protein